MRTIKEGKPFPVNHGHDMREISDWDFIRMGGLIEDAFTRKWGEPYLDPTKKTVLVLVDPQAAFLTDNSITNKLGDRSGGRAIIEFWQDIFWETQNVQNTYHNSPDLLVSLMIHDPKSLSSQRIRQLRQGACSDLIHEDANGDLRFPLLESGSPLVQIGWRMSNLQSPTYVMKKSERSLLEDPKIKEVLSRYSQVGLCGIDGSVCILATIKDWLTSQYNFNLFILPQLISDRSGNFVKVQYMYKRIIGLGRPMMINVTTYMNFLEQRANLLS